MEWYLWVLAAVLGTSMYLGIGTKFAQAVQFLSNRVARKKGRAEKESSPFQTWEFIMLWPILTAALGILIAAAMALLAVILSVVIALVTLALAVIIVILGIVCFVAIGILGLQAIAGVLEGPKVILETAIHKHPLYSYQKRGKEEAEKEKEEEENWSIPKG